MSILHEGLIDITNITVDTSLDKETRIKKFIEDVKDPYHFLVGDVEVTISFEPDGEKLQDKMERYFESLLLQ